MIVLALLVGIATAAKAQQSVSIVENQNYIEVNGYNKAEVAPDEIYITFQINEKDSRGRTSIDDQQRNLIRALQNIGVDIEKQLTINDMSSNFQKYILRRTDIQMSRDYQLKVASAQEAAAAFAALEGVNVANATIARAEYGKMADFTLENKVAAAKNAQEKATALAAALGQTIGKAIFIQDMERVYRPYSANVMVRGMAMDAGGGAESMPNIEFEKITVESNVTVRFILE